MPEYNVLTNDDFALLREMLRAFRDGRLGGSRGDRSHLDIDYMAPEVYIAKVPDAGIPGLTPASETGTATDQDHPGYAECDIYRILEVNGSPSLVEVGGFNKRVYNLSEDTIDADVRWITVLRSKFGQWLAAVSGSPSGGGGVGILTSNVTPATNILTGATFATADRIISDPDNPGDRMLGPSVALTNRDTTLSGNTGDLVMWREDYNENIIDYISCPVLGTATSSGS